MKKFIFSFLLCFALFEVDGQVNLVPNPSFEERTGCPEGYPDLDGVCNDWMSFRGSPDYFHNCSSMNGYTNNWGYQEPHSGEAYAGVITYGVTTPNAREHLAVELITPLTVGEKYFVSFFVSTAWNYTGMNIATNKQGVLFTTYPYNDPMLQNELPNFSQIKTDLIIYDTIVWTKIAGSFIADSTYKYIIIGSFYDDQNIDTFNLPFQQVVQASYYYLDDVCVSTDSLYANSWVSIKELLGANNIQIFPNPANTSITISAAHTIKQIEIYSASGILIDKFDVSKINESKLITSNWKNGMYYVKFYTDVGSLTEPIVIYH